MAKRQSGNIGWIVAIILCAAISFAALFHFSDGFENTAVTNFAVIHDGNWILANKSGLTFEKGDEIEVKQFDNTEQITVKVYALKNDRADVAFTYGARKETWNGSVAGLDVTDKFDVYVTQGTSEKNGRIKINGSLGSVVQGFVGNSTVKFDPITTRGDYFQMIITVDNASIALNFSVQVNPEKIILDQESVVF